MHFVWVFMDELQQPRVNGVLNKVEGQCIGDVGRRYGDGSRG